MGTITIDRAVLEQALELLDDAAGYGDGLSEIDAAYAIIQEALAAQQPEPVAFYNFQTHRMRWAKPTSYDKIVTVDMPELALYTGPPQRQPLTSEQITEILGDNCPAAVRRQLFLLIRATEAMHGIGGDT
jgi:hypothetical protein